MKNLIYIICVFTINHYGHIIEIIIWFKIVLKTTKGFATFYVFMVFDDEITLLTSIGNQTFNCYVKIIMILLILKCPVLIEAMEVKMARLR